MSAAGPPQGAKGAPSGGSAAAQPQAWGDHTSAPGDAKRSRGPKGAAACESGRPTRNGCGVVLQYKEAE